MGTLTPEHFEQAWHINGYLNTYIQLADTKAGAVVGVTALSTAALSVLPDELKPVQFWCVTLSVVALLIGSILAFLVIWPRVRRQVGSTTMYWGHIAAYGHHGLYEQAFVAADPVQEVIKANYDLSVVAAAKYTWLNRALVWQVLALLAFWTSVLSTRFVGIAAST